MIPVYTSLLSDRLTPVSAFERLVSPGEHAFLLESVIGGEKTARYSFLGTSPIARVESTGDRTTVNTESGTEVFEEADPLAVLEEVLGRYRALHPVELPRFLGGAVGYAGYDIARHYETLGTAPPDDRNLPELEFGIYDEMVVFDHVRKLVHVVVHAHLAADMTTEEAYDNACSRVESLVSRLEGARSDVLRPFVESSGVKTSLQSSMTAEEFKAAVEKCKEYIRAGDIFQVVISQRLSGVTKAEPFDVYRALRVVNPSPFMFYLQTPAATLVGASPEVLCRVEGGQVSTRPLAGTRPRGRSESEDLGLEAELRADPKERAEHVMLVDLGRNDLGRVCASGSVKVDELMSVERFSHVMHLCSNVVGTLLEDKNAIDAVRNVLPVGTVSGAPKIRAMQIIDELEPVRRGPYAGAVGYIDFSGNMDSCIALRTLVITANNDGSYRVDAQVGAGIVADSEPDREYEETLNKAMGMLTALQIADSWLESKD